MKEAKAGGAYVDGGTSLHTLLTQLALRMQDQGNNFRKVRPPDCWKLQRISLSLCTQRW